MVLAVYMPMAFLNPHSSPQSRRCMDTPSFSHQTFFLSQDPSLHPSCRLVLCIGSFTFYAGTPLPPRFANALPSACDVLFTSASIFCPPPFKRTDTYMHVHEHTHTCLHTHIGTFCLSFYFNSCHQITFQRLGAHVWYSCWLMRGPFQWVEKTYHKRKNGLE